MGEWERCMGRDDSGVVGMGEWERCMWRDDSGFVGMREEGKAWVMGERKGPGA